MEMRGKPPSRICGCVFARSTVSDIKIRALSIINIKDGDHLHTRLVLAAPSMARYRRAVTSSIGDPKEGERTPKKMDVF